MCTSLRFGIVHILSLVGFAGSERTTARPAKAKQKTECFCLEELVSFVAPDDFNKNDESSSAATAIVIAASSGDSLYLGVLHNVNTALTKSSFRSILVHLLIRATVES